MLCILKNKNNIIMISIDDVDEQLEKLTNKVIERIKVL